MDKENPIKIIDFKSQGSRKSDVWNYFGFASKSANDNTADKTKVVCKLCYQVMPYSGNTTNMRAHSDRKHYHVTHKTSQVKETTGTGSTKGSVKASAVQQSVMASFQNQKPLAKDSKTYQDLTKAIARFIVIDMQSLAIVEGEGFKALMKIAEPRYQVPSRNHILEKQIVPMYHETVIEVKNALKKGIRHAFTTDAWTSINMDSFITTTCHFIKYDTFELVSKVLDTKCVKIRHTAENLAMEMKETVIQWGMNDPVSVTDNAANVVNACNEAGYPHIGCFGHTLNLAVNRCLEVSEVKSLIGKCKKLVAVFKQSYIKTMELHSAQAALEIKELQVIQDVETRWNSALLMLKRLLQIIPAIWSVLYKDPKHKHLLPNDNERTGIEGLVELLGPIEIASRMVSSEKNPTASLILPIIERLFSHDLSAKDTDTALIKKAKSAMMTDLLKRYQDESSKKILRIATVLDPRFKALTWMDEDERNEIYEELKNEMMTVDCGLLTSVTKIKTEPDADSELLEEPQPSQPQPSSSASETDVARLPSLPTLPTINIGLDQNEVNELSDIKPEINVLPPLTNSQTNSPIKKKMKEEDDFFDVLFVKEEKVSTNKADMICREIDNYKSVKPILAKDNPLDWWRTNRMTFPIMSNVCAQYLHIPATSVPSERVFSSAGNILNKKRGALTGENANMLIFLYHNTLV